MASVKLRRYRFSSGRLLTPLVLLGLLLLLHHTAIEAFAQTNGGYIGIYGDPAGTNPCVIVAQGTGTTLFVLVKTAGATSTGITGAEFRVEVSNPSGWFLSYSPPVGTTAFGNVLDTSPADSADGSGLNIAFGNCQVPAAGKVSLGTIAVFNMSGTATTLSVKRHSNPKNQNYRCPLFTLCDAPTFSKSCMSPSSEVSCLTLKTTAGTSAGDPAVFDATLNRPQPDSSQPVPFTEAVSLGSAELWVAGHQVTGAEAIMTFDGATLSIGGIVLPMELPQRQLSVAELTWAYGQAPRVQALIAEGLPTSQAVARFEGEVDSLIANGYVALTRGGIPSVCDVFRASPLIENAECGETTVSFTLRGLLGRRAVNLAAKLPEGARPLARHQRVQELVNSIKSDFSRQWDGGSLLVVDSGGGTRFIGGPLSVAARAQIHHVVTGGALETMPQGPFHPEDPMIREIFAVARGNQ